MIVEELSKSHLLIELDGISEYNNPQLRHSSKNMILYPPTMSEKNHALETRSMNASDQNQDSGSGSSCNRINPLLQRSNTPTETYFSVQSTVATTVLS